MELHRLIPYILIFTVVFTYGYFQPFDSTDDETNRERSGMILYTDHMTGCQYLQAGILGGITNRVDINGNHVGCH